MCVLTSKFFPLQGVQILIRKLGSFKDQNEIYLQIL